LIENPGREDYHGIKKPFRDPGNGPDSEKKMFALASVFVLLVRRGISLPFARPRRGAQFPGERWAN